MKKNILTFLGFLIFVLPGFLFAQTCDYVDPLKNLRYNQAYLFTDFFTNIRNNEIEITLFDVNPFPDDAPLQILFNPQETALIYSKNLNVGQQQDFTGTYRVDFCATNDPDNCDTHTECAPYHVTRCGDGNIDNKHDAPGETWQLELCDSGVNNTNTAPVPPYSLTPPPNTIDYCLTNCTAATATGGYCGDGILDILLPPPLQAEECELNDETGLWETCGIGQECQSCQCIDLPIPGVCNSVYSGQSFETNNTGYLDEQSLVTNGQPSLCSSGYAGQGDATYDPQTGYWTWTCFGEYGGTNTECNARRTWCGDGEFNGNQESCDPGTGPHGNGDLGECGPGEFCSNICECEPKPTPIPGVCNSVYSGQSFETNLTGYLDEQSLVTNGQPSLCSSGYAGQGDATYDPQTGYWTWTCFGDYGGTNTECNARRTWCGDGEFNGNQESCDPGTGPHGNGDLGECGVNEHCTMSCECSANPSIVTGVCNSVYSGQSFETNLTGYLDEQSLVTNGQPSLCSSGYAGQGDATYDPQTGFWTWTCFGENGGTNAECNARRTWCGDGEFNGNQELCDPGTGPHGDGDLGECDANQVCNASCSCDSVTLPTCSYSSGLNVYDFDDQGDKPLSSTMNGLCVAPATVEWLGYNAATHRWEWKCKNGNLVSDICHIQEFYCGDGIVLPTSNYLPVPYSDPQPWLLEECEDNNVSNTDGCITFTGANYDIPRCKRAKCGDGIVQPLGADGVTSTDDEVCDDGDQDNNDECNNSCQPQTLRCINDNSCEMSTNNNFPECNTPSDCYVPLCGNGTIDQAEECNEPGLQCPSGYACDTQNCNCVDVQFCGNGTIDQDEECNEPGLVCNSNESCDTTSCQCNPISYCGDGNQDIDEECDDGNQVETDACNNCNIQDLRCTTTSSCELSIDQNLPSCDSTNDCSPMVTYCGDNDIQTPNSNGFNEQCDNGNQNGVPCIPSYGTTCSFCTAGCLLTGLIGPNCGDGIPQAPEECDLGVGNGPMGDCSLMCKHNLCHPMTSDLVIFKELVQHSDTCANMTGDLIFKLHYSNVGSGMVSGVVVQDILPIGVSYLSYDSSPLLISPTVTMSGSLLTFDIGSLVAGQSGTITIYAKMMIGGVCPPGLTNTATISLPLGDPTPYNNTSSVGIPCHNNSCDLLTVTPQTGVAPMTSQFICQGMGSNYQIVIKNKFGATIHTINAQTGSYSFQDIGSYSVDCFVDGKTSAVCNKMVTVGGSCEALSTDVKDQSLVPFTGSLTCKGNGSQFEIQLFKDNLLQKSWKQQGGSGLTVSHYFNEAGNYRSICYVDGVSHPVCSDPSAVFTTQSLTDTLAMYQQQKPESSLINTNVMISTTIDPKAQLVSLDTIVQAQQQDAIDVFMKQKLSQLQSNDIKPAPVTTPIVSQGIDFHNYIDQQTKQFQATQHAQCQDLCQLSFVLKTPAYTGYCGDAVVQKPNGSGLNEQCDYGTTGNNGQVSINGSVCLPGCLLPSGGGGGGGGGNNYCGDGITRNGEECDNGSTGNNGTSLINGLICDSNCKKVGGGTASGGGAGGGGSSTPTCGNNIREAGEACDLGNKNGDASICTSNCRLKGFTPNDPKCEYIDPPSIQAGEMLPIRWNYEGGGDLIDGSCTTGTAGKIMQSSLLCHFSIKNPKNIEVDRFTRPCDGNDIDSQKWYPDFVNSLPVATRSLLQSSIGVTSWDASKINADSPFAIFGEYTVSLDKISYDICRFDGQSFNIASDSYEDRVCQYNFAVTTPYAIQKGVGLSSFADDKDILSKFFSLGGDQILKGVTFSPLSTKSSVDVAATLEPLIERYAVQASQQVVEATSLFKGMKKIPGQEIYVTDRNFVLDTRSNINDNKATVLLAMGDVSIRVLGSLHSRMMILAPQGTITFENIDCDMTDTVEGVFVAGSFDTNTVKNTMASDTWCSGGGLVVNGLLIGGGESGIKSLRDRRRSTLNNWFSSSDQRDQQIFDGASLRIQSNVKLRDGLPQMVSEVMKELRVTK